MLNKIGDLFKQQSDVAEHFDAIKIGIASPEKIRSWSYGEVKRDLRKVRRRSDARESSP